MTEPGIHRSGGDGRYSLVLYAPKTRVLDETRTHPARVASRRILPHLERWRRKLSVKAP